MAQLSVLAPDFAGLASDEVSNVMGTFFEATAIVLWDLCVGDAAFRKARGTAGLAARDWQGLNRDNAMAGEFWRVINARTMRATSGSGEAVAHGGLVCRPELRPAATEWVRELKGQGVPVTIRTSHNSNFSVARMCVATPLGMIVVTVQDAGMVALIETLPTQSSATLKLVDAKIEPRGCSDAVARLLSKYTLVLSVAETTLDLCYLYPIPTSTGTPGSPSAPQSIDKSTRGTRP
ncbi:unnamed protein product [Parajaminaea phylloscopi]